MTWLKVSESISMQMDQSMLDTGIKTNNMDSEKKSGMITVCIKGSTRTLQKKVKESTVGQMVTDMSVNGVLICLMEKDFLSGMMIGYILVIGRTI